MSKKRRNDPPTQHPEWSPETGWRYPTNPPDHHRRSYHHNYAAPGTYLITLCIEGREPLFGQVEGDIRAKRYSAPYPHLIPTPLGKDIETLERQKIKKYYPMVEVWKFCLMPDHIHMILRVTDNLPPGKHLGHVIKGFKTGCSRAWWWHAFGYDWEKQAWTNDSAGETADTGAPALPLLFESGYNDHILLREGQLQHWKDYLDDNPWRLLARKQNKHLMQRRLCIEIAGHRYAAFGNFMLLRKPDKQQVFCHRKARYGQLSEQEKSTIKGTYSDTCVTSIPYETTEAYKQESLRWIEAAASGNAVIVTPGISRGELMVKNTCVENRLPLIHLQKEPIGPLWKPEKSRFEACLAGTLLILAPLNQDAALQEKQQAQGLSPDNPISDYARFHNLNHLAASICSLDYAVSMKIVDL